MNSKAIILAASILPLVASAKTVALWPFVGNGAKCVIDSRNDLTTPVPSSVTYEDNTIGWQLPPNPDVDGAEGVLHLEKPIARKQASYGNSGDSQLISIAPAPLINAALDTQNKSFTIEGYLKMDNLTPEGSAKDRSQILMYAKKSNGSYIGWALMLLNKCSDKGAGDGVTVYLNTSLKPLNTTFDNFTAEEVKGLTNGWNHIALVYNNTGKTWTFYLNGVSKGSVVKDIYGDKGGEPDNYNPEKDNAFGIGHHLNKWDGDGRTVLGKYCYWRISDKALAPSEFLNYDLSGKGGTVLENSTVGFWPFSSSASGVVDAHDRYGQAHFVEARAVDSTTSQFGVPGRILTPDEDCAFENNPPNKTVTFTRGGEAVGNHGSWLGVQGISGRYVTTAASIGTTFTIEGWLKPRVHSTTALSDNEWICGTMLDTNATTPGWIFGFKRNTATGGYFTLMAQTGGGAAHDLISYPNMGTVADWGEEWKHVALVCNAGTWTVYVDGVAVGSTTSTSVPTGTNIYFGSPFNKSFYGLFDAWRLSSAALTPKQFLNCADDDAQAATGVVATWPMNVKCGAMLGSAALETADGSATYNLLPYRTSDYAEGVLRTDTAQSVSFGNPEKGSAFTGAVSERSGSSGVWETKVNGTYRNDVTLITSDTTVRDCFGSEEGFTLECYFKYESADWSWQSYGRILGMYQNCNQNNAGYCIAIGQKDTENVKKGWLYVNRGIVGASFDEAHGTLLTGTSIYDINSLRNDGKWHHLAIVRTLPVVDSVVMSHMDYYLDGEKIYSSEAASVNYGKDGKKFNPVTTTLLAYGGGFNSDQPFGGKLGPLRVSRGALDPSQFLCAAGSPLPVDEKQTLAFWPLDNDAGSAVLSTGCGLYSLGFSAADGIVGNTACAIPKLAYDPMGYGKPNVGSVDVGANAMATASATDRLDLDRAWTVEGWIRSGLGGKSGAYELVRFGSDTAYWQLTLDESRDHTFALRAVAPNCTPFALGEFVATGDAKPVVNANGWNHVALVYDPSVGLGQWNLYVNGRAAGTLASAWRNVSLLPASSKLTLGTNGRYDLWRVSQGALGVDELLYRARLGLRILIR